MRRIRTGQARNGRFHSPPGPELPVGLGRFGRSSFCIPFRRFSERTTNQSSTPNKFHIIKSSNTSIVCIIYMEACFKAPNHSSASNLMWDKIRSQREQTRLYARNIGIWNRDRVVVIHRRLSIVGDLE